MRIFAGLDVNRRPTLYYVTADRELGAELAWEDWLKILDELGAEPGEMLEVGLSREGRRDLQVVQHPGT